MGGGGATTPIRYDMAWPAVISQVIDSTHFVSDGLAGFDNGQFVGYSVWVLSKLDGTSTGPKGEAPKSITNFIGRNGTGTKGSVTHSAFVVNLAVGDTVLIMNPAVASAFVTRPTPGVLVSTGNPPAVDFWSTYQEEVAVTNVAGDKSLPNVVVAGLPTGAINVRAIAFFKARMIENTNVAANKLSGAQNIQIRTSVGPGAWVSAIALVDDLFSIAASTRESGDALIGAVDVSAVVAGNGTYNFQWAQAIADVANLNFNDVQVGLRVWYSV